MKEKWDCIPENTGLALFFQLSPFFAFFLFLPIIYFVDILITHGPPMGILDKTIEEQEHVGCADLLDAVKRVKPKVHIFGNFLLFSIFEIIFLIYFQDIFMRDMELSRTTILSTLMPPI